MALARSVFPVPGGPTNKAPFGTVAPNFWNLLGFFKKSITSFNSSFASSQPATSLKVTLGWSDVHKAALLFPNLKIPPTPPAPPCIRLIIKNQNPRSNIHGSIFKRYPVQSIVFSLNVYSKPAVSHSLVFSRSTKGNVSLKCVMSFNCVPKGELID